MSCPRPPLYELWRGMIRRCHDPGATGFSNYGGRGIKVCQRWRRSFHNFVSDVGQRPSPDHTLDRKNNNGNYEPRNVQWASKNDQARNTRRNRFLTAHGKTQTLEAWVSDTHLHKSTLFNRLRRGWSIADALDTPPQHKSPNHTLFPIGGYQRCLHLGLNYQTVKSRLLRGWTFKAAISKPIDRRRNRHAGN